MRDLIQQGLALRELLRERILILDGAMGTMLQQVNLTAEDFGGPHLEGCNENLVITRPDVVLGIHRKYLEAGSDIIETNSFGSTPVVLAEYGLGEHAHEISRRAAELARQAADEFSTAAKPRFVAGSMGPTTKAISVTGGITFEQLRNNFCDQARGLIEGGADLLLLETCQDTRNIKAGVLAIDELSRELGQPIPVMISVTIEPMGTMLAGQTIEALWASLDHVDVLSLGLNCATGPEFMTDHVRTLQSLTNRFVSCYPERRPAQRRRAISGDADHPCRAAGPLRRARLAEHRRWLLRNHRKAYSRHRSNGAGESPRHPAGASHRAVYSGIEVVEAEESTRPLIVGERTNVIGSREFKKLVAAEQWEEATEIARRQVKSGAHIVDVCLQSTDRDEIKDIPPFYDQLIRKIKAPIMIDTTDAAGDRAGPHVLPGKEHHQFDQPRRRRGEIRARLPAWLVPTAPRSLSAASTKTRSRRRPSRANANSKSQSVPTSCSPGNTASTLRTSFSIRWSFPAPRAMRTISAARWKPSKASG